MRSVTEATCNAQCHGIHPIEPHSPSFLFYPILKSMERNISYFSFLASFLTLGYVTYSQCKGNVVNVTESKEAEVLSHCLQYSLCYLTFQMWEIAIFLQQSKAMVLRTILSCFPVIIPSDRSMPLVLSKELLER